MNLRTITICALFILACSIIGTYATAGVGVLDTVFTIGVVTSGLVIFTTCTALQVKIDQSEEKLEELIERANRSLKSAPPDKVAQAAPLIAKARQSQENAQRNVREGLHAGPEIRHRTEGIASAKRAIEILSPPAS